MCQIPSRKIWMRNEDCKWYKWKVKPEMILSWRFNQKERERERDLKYYSPCTSRSTMASGMWRSLTRQMYSVVSLARAGANCSPKLSDKSWICNGWMRMWKSGQICGLIIITTFYSYLSAVCIPIAGTVLCPGLAWPGPSLIYFGLPSVSITNKFATTCAKQVQSNWDKRQWEGNNSTQKERGRKRGGPATLTVADNNVDNTSFYFRLHKLFNTKDK